MLQFTAVMVCDEASNWTDMPPMEKAPLLPSENVMAGIALISGNSKAYQEA